MRTLLFGTRPRDRDNGLVQLGVFGPSPYSNANRGFNNDTVRGDLYISGGSIMIMFTENTYEQTDAIVQVHGTTPSPYSPPLHPSADARSRFPSVKENMSIYGCMHNAHIRISIYPSIHVAIVQRIHVSVYTCIHVAMYIYIYVYIYIYI